MIVDELLQPTLGGAQDILRLTEYLDTRAKEAYVYEENKTHKLVKLCQWLAHLNSRKGPNTGHQISN